MNEFYLLRSPAWIQPKVPEGMVELFKKHGNTLKLKKNNIIAHEGDALNTVYYVENGLCKYTFSQLAEEAITLCLILPGRTIGDIFAVIETDLFFRFETVQDSVLKTIPRSIFMQELRSNNDFALTMMTYFANKQHSHVEGMICNATLPANQKLAILLINIAKDNPAADKDGYIKLPYKLTQDILAEVTTVSRVTVNRTLSEWFDEGILKKKNGFLYLSDKFLQ